MVNFRNSAGYVLKEEYGLNIFAKGLVKEQSAEREVEGLTVAVTVVREDIKQSVDSTDCVMDEFVKGLHKSEELYRIVSLLTFIAKVIKKYEEIIKTFLSSQK